jgi:hypothetical protein
MPLSSVIRSLGFLISILWGPGDAFVMGVIRVPSCLRDPDCSRNRGLGLLAQAWFMATIIHQSPILEGVVSPTMPFAEGQRGHVEDRRHRRTRGGSIKTGRPPPFWKPGNLQCQQRVITAPTKAGRRSEEWGTYGGSPMGLVKSKRRPCSGTICPATHPSTVK